VIYPSIPYHLSVYKRISPEFPPTKFSTGVDALDRVLGGEGDSSAQPYPGGLPQRRCTGFIGRRGGHKSHLGYLSLLKHVLEHDHGHRAIIVSLRDDENMARQTLEKILRQELELLDKAERKLLELELSGRLEILFFPPGHITPEEFYHRVIVTVLGMKRHVDQNEEVVVLFNSLDQLASRFPLCAEEKIFLPGMIETLTAEGVTSIFIGVDEQGQPAEQYGLLAMADALISFDRFSISKVDYVGHIKDHFEPEDTGAFNRFAASLPDVCRPVVLNIERFAGGQAAKQGGILELVESPAQEPIFGRSFGLAFVPFSPKYARGTSA
jgi:KaiC/GvpD/RAD55 family RecA-like ATPase